MKFLAGLTLLFVLVLPITSTHAQTGLTIEPLQKYEYLVMNWKLGDVVEFTWDVSSLYIETQDNREEIQKGFDMLTTLGQDETGQKFGLADYLAILGLSGFELVSVVQVDDATLLYHFKRPLYNEN